MTEPQETTEADDAVELTAESQAEQDEHHEWPDVPRVGREHYDEPEAGQ